MTFRFGRSDFDFSGKDALKKTRLHLLELEDSLKPRLRAASTLREFAGSTYVSRIVSHSGEMREAMWLGFAHRKLENPRTAVQFQYGTNDSGSSFFCIWIQGDGASRKARIRAHDSLRRFAAPEVLDKVRALKGDAYLWCRADKTGRYPRFEINEFVADLTEDDIEDFVWSLGKRRLWVEIGWHRTKNYLLKLRHIETEIIRATTELLPIYNLLTGLGSTSLRSTRSASPRGSKPGPFDDEQKEMQKLPLPARSEVLSEARRRIGQGLVRQNAETNYPEGCAMCEPTIALQGLLVASHIRRWAESSRLERFDKANVLRLCAMHDELFERGYLAIDDDMRILYSSRLTDGATLRFLKNSSRDKIRSWKDVPPGKNYLERHRSRHSDMEPFYPVSQLPPNA